MFRGNPIRKERNEWTKSKLKKNVRLVKIVRRTTITHESSYNIKKILIGQTNQREYQDESQSVNEKVNAEVSVWVKERNCLVKITIRILFNQWLDMENKVAMYYVYKRQSLQQLFRAFFL